MTDELIVNGTSLDMSEMLPVPISFAIADVKDPSKRKQSFSKQVTLPDTMVNRSFFTGSFGLTVTENGISFDATSKATVTLKKRGVQVLDGVLKLDKVTVLNQELKFLCTVLSDNVDVFQLLSTIMVNELDWSAYDHLLNRTNIKASWTATAGTGYYYPLIERGNNRLGATIWRTTDLMPYIYLREALSKSLEWAGIEWDSAFLDTTQFKNILFGYGGGEIRTISATDQANRKVEIDNGDVANTLTAFCNTSYYQQTNTAISRDLSYSFNSFNPFLDTYFTNTVTSDTLDQYDNGEISIQQNGNYNLSFAMELDYSVNVGTMTFNSISSPRLIVRRNGTQIQEVTCSTPVHTTATGTFVLDTNTNFNMNLNSGDLLTFELKIQGVGVTAGIGVTAQTVSVALSTSTPITIDLTSIDTTITDGATVRLHNYIPPIKCSELLLGALRQFNLYQSEPSLDNITKIEPAIDFYSATDTFKDITQQIDHKKPMHIRPSANEYAKVIAYRFKESKDYDALQYFDKWKERYGDLEYQQGSYYAKGENKTELPWSTIIPYQVAPNILVPRFVKIENNVMKQNAGAPRIMFRNGQKTGNFTLRDTVGTGSEQLTAYPCVHHFDNWENPTMDLNFKLVNELFYTATIVTTTNCFSEYYSVFINEMTSPAGQLVTCSVTWDEQEIKARDFGKLLMINGGLFRLNSISEFSADVEASTEIELVKVLKAKKARRRQITRPAYVPPILGVGDLASPPGVGGDTGVILGGHNLVSTGNSKLIRG